MYKPVTNTHEQERLVSKQARSARSGRLWFSFNTSDKPPSNPHNWPNSTDEEILERPKRIIKVGQPQVYSFCDNFVKTSKYEVWNFLPKFLLEEFNPKTKIANCYFLLISGLQCIPVISNTNGYPTTMIPLLFVVFVDALFQIFEDISRHRADATANASITHRFNRETGLFEECQWHELSVGDLVRVNTRGMIPADMVIISVAETSEPAQGICYVETKSLDGETNLKIRTALPSTLAKVRDKSTFTSLTGEIEMEHPNKLIDSFNGVIDLQNLGRDPILHTNVLLRGCVLRNTEWVVGLVVNTGHDTKIMMSSRSTRSKTSDLETKASNEIKRIIILLALVCFAGATGAAIWNDTFHIERMKYLRAPSNAISFWFVDFFYFFLLHATFIPVSLYVSMSVARYFQSKFMQMDLAMYYEPIDAPALVRTMTLNEELGQISHVFSDKTGTLTCNIMDFRKASINGVTYGEGITEIGKAAWRLQGKVIPPAMLEAEARAKANAKPHVSFYCPRYERDLKESRESMQREKIRTFFRCLSLCHDVIAEKIDGNVKLSASSPDDEALVCAADHFGWKFLDRRDKFCVILDAESGREQQVEIILVIPFSSKRKRMSVVCRDLDGQVKLITKGADTVMIPRFQAGQDALLAATDRATRDFAIEGLRCLFVGQSLLNEETFQQWLAEYRRATTDLTQIEKKKRGDENDIEELEDILERGLILLGATAIEDRLQDGVPECIKELVTAGVNIWVLTGDKEETAINIAVACNLIQPKEYMDHIIINPLNAPTKEKMRAVLLTEIQRFNNDLLGEDDDDGNIAANLSGPKPRALIIDGPSLLLITHGEESDELKELLLDVATRCQAVVGCRVSPDQKREMVHLIKSGVPGVRTLAIGDGANDVAMIQEAHVGVGIKGEEGLQAVNSADYAIAQFRFLSELMLKHGRSNYIRMSNLICYMFYKNILMSIAQFWFNFSNAFSGQKYYTEGAIQLFNLMYTSFPILLYAIYDMDIRPETAHRFPKLYQAGINGEYFKTSVFWEWIVAAVIESIVLSVLPLYTLLYQYQDRGSTEQILAAGMTCLTAIVTVVNLKMFFIQFRWYLVSIAVIVMSLAFYMASLFFINSFYLLDFNFYQVWYKLLSGGSFWLTLFMLVVIIFAKDVYITGVRRNFTYGPQHIIQELEAYDKLKDIKDDEEGDESDEPDEQPNQQSLFGRLKNVAVSMGIARMATPKRKKRVDIEIPQTPPDGGVGRSGNSASNGSLQTHQIQVRPIGQPVASSFEAQARMLPR